MDLKEYFKESGVSRRDFAKKVGITPGFLSYVESGQRHPSLDVAMAIQKESHGKITVVDLIHPGKVEDVEKMKKLISSSK